MPYYKAQHEVFVRAVIRHGDQLAAYRQAYPNASEKSAYTAAIRLLRRPHIQARVAVAMLRHTQQENQRAQEREERKQRMAEEDSLQKRLWLASVVRGEVMKQRYMRFRGRTILLHETLSPFIVIAAIELDTRYEYGTNPKIILDRQFARLYARATRPVGLHCVTKTTQRPIKAVISTVRRNLPSTYTQLHRRTSGDLPPVRKFSLHSAALHSVRNDELFLAEKNTQNASKKLTDLKQNPRPAMHLASNNPAVCNKIETHPARTSAAIMHRADLVTAHYIIIDDNGLDWAAGDSAVSRQILLPHLRDQNDSLDWTTSDTAESQEISRDARNDECYLAFPKPASAVWR